MKKIVLLIILLALSGCSTTNWQRLSVDYSEKQLGENKFEISFLRQNWIDEPPDSPHYYPLIYDKNKLPKDKSLLFFFDGYAYSYLSPLSDSGIFNSAVFAMKKGYKYFSIIEALKGGGKRSDVAWKQSATVTILCFNEIPGNNDYYEAESTAMLIRQKYGIE